MLDQKKYEVWFTTGSQHLYGEETLKQVENHSRLIAEAYNDSAKIPVKVVYKPLLTNAASITQLCLEANADANCIGLITWMHTFSPAKMWINGLKLLQKPFVHLHTQFNKEIPWQDMDMDFMNLNQSAHGGREFGHIATRLGIDRSTRVIGKKAVQDELARWLRVALGWHVWQTTKIARFGDNMRDVAVTSGDKVGSTAVWFFR